MNHHIFSRCVYDVDGRYVDMEIRPINGGTFMLKMSDTSNEEEFDTEVELYLTKEDLRKVIDRLTEVLQDERPN